MVNTSYSRLLKAINEHARHRPNAPAVTEIGGAAMACTYAQLAESIATRAHQLADRIEPRGTLITVLPGGVDYVSWFCAAIAAGVRLLPMHPQIAGPEAFAVAQRVGASAALIAPDLAAAQALAHLTLSPNNTTRHGNGNDASTLREHAGAVVLGSSGTMGLPKLALRESSSLDADAGAVIHGMGLTPADRVAFATPLSHSYGVDVLVGTLTAGAHLRVMPTFDAEVLAHEIEECATILPGVPFIFEALCRHAPQRHTSLRLAVSAGSPLSPRIRKEFLATWSAEIGQLYGSTELGTVAMDIPGKPGFDPASVGHALPGVSMRVLDVDDPRRAVVPGAEGQLAVRAASMLSRYLDGDTPLIDGHMLTGDLARIDADGRVRITGRLKMLVDVGAYKVNPLEVEQVLMTHPGVAECVVVPLPVSETLQRLRAVVVPRVPGQPPTAESLRRHVRERLSPIKVPRVIELVPALPKSATGKVIRDAV